MDFASILAIAAAATICVNGCIYALHAFITSFKDATASDVDNKIDSVLDKILSVLAKVLEFFGAIKKPA